MKPLGYYYQRNIRNDLIRQFVGMCLYQNELTAKQLLRLVNELWPDVPYVSICCMLGRNCERVFSRIAHKWTCRSLPFYWKNAESRVASVGEMVATKLMDKEFKNLGQRTRGSRKTEEAIFQLTISIASSIATNDNALQEFIGPTYEAVIDAMSAGICDERELRRMALDAIKGSWKNEKSYHTGSIDAIKASCGWEPTSELIEE